MDIFNGKVRYLILKGTNKMEKLRCAGMDSCSEMEKHSSIHVYLTTKSILFSGFYFSVYYMLKTAVLMDWLLLKKLHNLWSIKITVLGSLNTTHIQNGAR